MIGSVSKEVLEAMLETIPIEFSVVDAKDEVLAWNRHETRIFKRPETVVGRNVRNCHPKKSLHIVNRLLEEFKSGTREDATFWINMDGRKIFIRYFPVRSKEGKYLGSLEVTQDITDVQKIEGEKRLLDE